ncbi:hypothetical protein ACFX10_026774 [Malus domestica]
MRYSSQRTLWTVSLKCVQHYYGSKTRVMILPYTLRQDMGVLKQKLIRKTNNKKDTALHEAVLFNYFGVVEILTKEDPEFSYSANDAGETPLYLAVERGLIIVFKYLKVAKIQLMKAQMVERLCTLQLSAMMK